MSIFEGKEKKSKKTVFAQDLQEKTEKLLAKKDFEIHHNEYHRMIKTGDDISDVPELYLENLKTEGVL